MQTKQPQNNACSNPGCTDDARRKFVLTAFDRYEQRLTAYALRLRNGDIHAARDAVQQTFLKLCQQAPEAVENKLAAWLYTVCRNRIFDEKSSAGSQTRELKKGVDPLKIQIEFNPAEVQSYRLLGYENRLLATEDFDNDQKDAGEIGAGHSVTAIYELVTTNSHKPQVDAEPQNLKYQTSTRISPAVAEKNWDRLALSEAAASGELATVSLRYKQPDANTSRKFEVTIKNEPRSFSAASTDFRFAASVAAFGMWLRNSRYSGNTIPEMIEQIAVNSLGDDESGYRAEFVDLVRKTILR